LGGYQINRRHIGDTLMAKAYIVVNDLNKSKSWPTDSKYFKTAHVNADKAEKKKYGKSYERMEGIDAKLQKNELAGHNTKTGEIKVNKKIPKGFRKEVAFHEQKEFKKIKQMEKSK
jgi:hypothetical protein